MLDRLHFHRAILDHLQEPVLACDSVGLIQYMNPMAERITGWPLWEAVNLPVEDVLTPDRTDWNGLGPDQMMNSGECVLQQSCRFKTRWGRTLERKINVSPLYQGVYRCGTVFVIDHGLGPEDRED